MNLNYTIQLYSENIPKNSENYFNFKNINNKSIKKLDKSFFILDFNSIDKKISKRIIKKLLRLKNKINIGFYDKKNKYYIIAKAYNYDINNKFHNDLINSIYAVFKNSINDMYNYIYDTVCDDLDKEFIEKNLCDFRSDKCGEKRNTSCAVGCCRHYKNKILGPLPFNKFVVCEYLKNKKCSAKCLSCKLFTCNYLNKKGVKFKIHDIFLLDTFFNLIQKFIIKTSVYTPKEKILKKLMFFSYF